MELNGTVVVNGATLRHGEMPHLHQPFSRSSTTVGDIFIPIAAIIRHLSLNAHAPVAGRDNAYTLQRIVIRGVAGDRGDCPSAALLRRSAP